MTVVAVGISKSGQVGYAVNQNETEEGCNGYVGQCGCTHAEKILIEKVMPNPVTVILTYSPCMDCARLLVDAGVRSVYFAMPYRLSDGIHYLTHKGVRVSRKVSCAL